MKLCFFILLSNLFVGKSPSSSPFFVRESMSKSYKSYKLHKLRAQQQPHKSKKTKRAKQYRAYSYRPIYYYNAYNISIFYFNCSRFFTLFLRLSICTRNIHKAPANWRVWPKGHEDCAYVCYSVSACHCHRHQIQRRTSTQQTAWLVHPMRMNLSN